MDAAVSSQQTTFAVLTAHQVVLAGDADLCMGTCAGRDRARQESSL